MRIFITGGMGSGKTTVTKRLAELGAGVVLADEVGHENLENPQMKEELRQAFGQDVFDSNGEVDRKALASKAFVNAESTRKLDSITQPWLYKGILRHLKELERDHAVVVLEMAILDGRDDFADNADVVICVTTSENVRVERLMQYRGFTEEEARARIAQQVPEEVRIGIADQVFLNDGTPDDLVHQVDAWWQEMGL